MLGYCWERGGYGEWCKGGEWGFVNVLGFCVGIVVIEESILS